MIDKNARITILTSTYNRPESLKNYINLYVSKLIREWFGGSWMMEVLLLCRRL